MVTILTYSTQYVISFLRFISNCAVVVAVALLIVYGFQANDTNVVVVRRGDAMRIASTYCMIV